MNSEKIRVYQLTNGNYGFVNFDNCRRVEITPTEKDIYDQMASEKTTNIEGGRQLVTKMIKSGIYSKCEINPELVPSREQRQTVHLYVTDNCNYHCKYCYADAAPHAPNEAALTYENGKMIIDAIAVCGFKEVVFTGGEPFLCNVLFKLASYARRKFLVVGLLTNGYYVTEETARKCQCFHYVKLSLDGSEARYHDPMRGSGSFDQTVKAIKRLQNYHIKLEIGSVITKINMSNISDLLTFISKDLQIDMHSLVQYSGGKRRIHAQMECSCDEILKINEEIFTYKIDRLSGMKNATQRPEFFLPSTPAPHCGMGITEILIDYYGDVYPCRMSRYETFRMGNIMNDGLETILTDFFKADLVKRISVDSLTQCMKCDYKYLCSGGCRMHHAGITGSIEKTDGFTCDILRTQIDNKLSWTYYYTN